MMAAAYELVCLCYLIAGVLSMLVGMNTDGCILLCAALLASIRAHLERKA